MIILTSLELVAVSFFNMNHVPFALNRYFKQIFNYSNIFCNKIVYFADNVYSNWDFKIKRRALWGR